MVDALFCSMGCGCAERARKILELLGYKLEAGNWTFGGASIPDVSVDRASFKTAVQAIITRMTETQRNDMNARLKVFFPNRPT